MSNVSDLKRFLEGKPKGSKWDIATSQYAYNTTAPGYRFDFHSSAPAVRSLVKQGIIEADCGWRYYQVTVL